MGKEELTRQLGDGLNKLLIAKAKSQHEINRFQEAFDELYQDKICDSYIYLRRYGVNHFIFYDDKRCMVIKPIDQYEKDKDEPEVLFKFSRFSYHSAWSLRFGLENIYRDDKDQLFRFKTAFVLEDYGERKSFRPSCLDYAVLRQGFTTMKLSDPLMICITDDDKEVNSLEGRILEISDNPDRNRKPC